MNFRPISEFVRKNATETAIGALACVVLFVLLGVAARTKKSKQLPGAGLRRGGAYASSGTSVSELRELRLGQEEAERIVRDHAKEFISKAREQGHEPDFAEWIRKLHPENVSPNFTQTEEIDPRIYQTGSNYRVVWNEEVELASREVPGRGT